MELTINALRGIDRWGASDLLERAFAGFTALPPPPAMRAKRSWEDVLGCNVRDTLEKIKRCRNELMFHAHPDHGGTVEDQIEIQEAYKEAEKAKLGL